MHNILCFVVRFNKVVNTFHLTPTFITYIWFFFLKYISKINSTHFASVILHTHCNGQCHWFWKTLLWSFGFPGNPGNSSSLPSSSRIRLRIFWEFFNKSSSWGHQACNSINNLNNQYRMHDYKTKGNFFVAVAQNCNPMVCPALEEGCGEGSFSW